MKQRLAWTGEPPIKGWGMLLFYGVGGLLLGVPVLLWSVFIIRVSLQTPIVAISGAMTILGIIALIAGILTYRRAGTTERF